MNAGIADAMDLSWMLAAVLQGWGEPAILDAYESERHPITEQVSHYAMDTSMNLARQRSAIPANIEEPGPEGDESRRRIGQEAYDINVGQFCCGGLNFGYFYDASPLIAYDGDRAPSYTIYDFEQSTVTRPAARRIFSCPTAPRCMTVSAPGSPCCASTVPLKSAGSSLRRNAPRSAAGARSGT